MKRIFFILLLLFGYAQAQNLPPYKPMFAGTVNEWWINICVPPGVPDFPTGLVENLKYFTNSKQDTVISEKTYLRLYFVQIYEGPLDTLLVGFIREDTTERKVFLRGVNIQSQEGVLWSFNYEVNDTLHLIGSSCSWAPFVEDIPGYGELSVTNVIETEFNGVTYRGYQGYGPDYATFGSYECIGNIQKGVFNEMSSCGGVEDLPRLVTRKRDGVYLYENPISIECMGPLKTNGKAIFKFDSGIHYDGKTDLLNFVSGRFSELTIYDLQGRLLLTKTLLLDTQTVSLSELTAQGLFIVEGKTVSGATLRVRIGRF